jgi:hypothetical protein
MDYREQPQKRKREEERTGARDPVPATKRKKEEDKPKLVFERRLVPLGDATPEQLEQLLDIASDPAIMKTIGKGTTWDKEHIDSLARQSGEDDRGPQEKRGYFHWILLSKVKPADQTTEQGEPKDQEADGEEEKKDKEPEEPEEKVVGYACLHPFKQKQALQIRIFVKPGGQGHGTAATNLAVESYMSLPIKYKQQIWSLVLPSNISSVRLFERLQDWRVERDMRVFGANHRAFLYSLKR